MSRLSSLSISQLPQRLILASCAKHELDTCIKVFLKLALFTDPTSSFFSYTETEDEVSLILDEDSLRQFESVQTALVVSPGVWRAIQVFEGSEAINETGIVANLSSPLTAAGINMIYLSTFKTDLILVSQENLDKAFACLSAKLEESKQQQQQQQTEQTDQQQPEQQVHTQKQQQQQQSTLLHKLPEGAQIILTPLDDKLNIAVFKNADYTHTTTHPVLRQFFFPSRPERFFSFTATPTETCMIIDEESLSTFPQEAVEVNLASWRAIQVLGEGSMGFSEMHVAVLSQLLASEGISIYFLSTFHTDFILVPEHKLNAALACLKKNLNVLMDTR